MRGLPVAGGFSRSAVQAEAGTETPWTGVIAAGLVALTLVLLAPIFSYLPRAALAAIIISAVTGLVDPGEMARLWRVKRGDFLLMALTFITALAVGLVEGVLIGVGASLAWFIVRTTRPHTAVLGRLPGTDTYRNIRNFPEARTFAGVVIVRIDAQFYFGNVTWLKDTLRDLEAESSEPVQAVIIEAASVNQLDSSAARALCQLARDYKDRGILFRLATVKQPVYRVMKNSGLAEMLGPDAFYLDLPSAVNATLAELSPETRVRI